MTDSNNIKRQIRADGASDFKISDEPEDFLVKKKPLIFLKTKGFGLNQVLYAHRFASILHLPGEVMIVKILNTI